MDYLYTLLKFIIGGSVIVGVTLLAEHADPRYGGMLAAAPIITTLAFLFTYSEAGQETTRQAGHLGILLCNPFSPVPAGFLVPDVQVQSPPEHWRGVRDLDRGGACHEPDRHWRVMGKPANGFDFLVHFCNPKKKE